MIYKNLETASDLIQRKKISNKQFFLLMSADKDLLHCSETKENIYIYKHSGSFEELTVFTLLDSSAPVQMKKKESYKLHCQVEAMCKFDCCRPMNMLYVDLDIVYLPDSAILIFHHCH